MIKTIQIRVSPTQAANPIELKYFVANEIGTQIDSIQFIHVTKRSIDARKKNIWINITADVFIDEPYINSKVYKTQYKPLVNNKTVHIIGAGPSGLFAALRLLEFGIKPIIIERGKNVKDRRRDLAAINKQHIVNPNSNYCFGEGGAGTYSDGKLYTRSHKRGDVNTILEIFVEHGADEHILVDAHPHIGTNKLPKIITAIRDKIIELGGEIYFNTKLIDIKQSQNRIKSIVVENVIDNNTKEFSVDELILCTGHSARDIFYLLEKRKILIEQKQFAVGVRVEHQQSLIDKIQYHCSTNDEIESTRNFLPASSYSLVEQVNGRGVYSFCMCPGGIIAPCATDIEEVVTNGWSPSKRNNQFANSGIVVSVEEEDTEPFKNFGVFAGLEFQKSMEHNAWMQGGKTQVAPAQRMIDFSSNKLSVNMPNCSYQPGIVSSPLHENLPYSIRTRLQEAFKTFGRKMKGYYTNDAIIVGVETRTSSPIRIPRDKEKMSHVQIINLYPVGEGAGYAGGIVSAAMDGRKSVDAIASKISIL